MVDMYLMKAEKGMKRVLVITAPTKTGGEDGEFWPTDMSEHQVFFFG
jgi:hypothetical protein